MASILQFFPRNPYHRFTEHEDPFVVLFVKIYQKSIFETDFAVIHRVVEAARNAGTPIGTSAPA
jgi:hypothetical protein